MDIQCPSCGEPWSVHHMRYDELYEWGLDAVTRKQFLDRGSRFDGPDDPARAAAAAEGWKFASDSVLSFTSCPCCKGESILQDAAQRRDFVAVAAMLSCDDDSLATDLSDGLFS